MGKTNTCAVSFKNKSMETWYQVWYFDGTEAKTFGFAVKDGIIIKHPNREWIGCDLAKDYKPFLIKIKAQVGKIQS